MCCATGWRSTRSTRAVCTLVRPAGRCTPRATPERAGRRSSVIFRPCCRSKFRHCRRRSRRRDDRRRGMIRVELPAHLRTLARVEHEVTLDVAAPATVRTVLDALEAAYPVLRGTIRDHVTQQRRPFVRFFACEQDLSHDPPDATLPPPVVNGSEPLLVVGALAGG